MLNVMLWFDTEDYITPESDDALHGLLNLLEARGIRGIFKIVGEKARMLQQRQRTDILTKLRNHEVGYHTDFHSIHPTVSEYLDACSFREGVRTFESREGNGWIDLERITGMKSTCYGQPGYSWGPQTFPALKHWGIDVYLDNHDAVTVGGKPFWYGGLLNLTGINGIMRMELQPDGLPLAIAKFNELYDQLPPDNRFVSIYYHPCEFSTTEFWDGVNFSNGANPPREQWKPAALRSPDEKERCLEQLGQFLDYTVTKDGVRYVMASEILGMEKSVADPLLPSEVKELASRMGNRLTYKVMEGRSLSAADIFRCFYQALTGREFPSQTLYGPEKHEASEISSVTVGQLVESLLAAQYPSIHSFRQLPDAFLVNGKRIHPVDVVCTMAYAIANELQGNDVVPVVKGVLETEQHVRDDEHWGPRWVIFPKELRVPNIVQMAKLQTWTLKPALF